MSKICVIVPVFRVINFINRCIDSILNQTFQSFELIITDDGSDDLCAEICDEYAVADSKIIIIHQKNAGLSVARNMGIDLCKSEYITFVDSDDWIHSQYLEVLYEGAKKYNTISMISAVYAQNEEESSQYNQNHLKKPFSFDIINVDDYYDYSIDFPFYTPINVWGKLFPTKLFIDIKFPKGKVYEDRFITHKLIFKYKEIVFYPCPMYFYNINMSGITYSKWSPRRFDDIEAIEEQLLYFKSRGLEKPYLFILNCYLDSLFINMWEIRQLDGQYKKEYIVFKKKLKSALYKYRKRLSIGHFSKYDYYVYPFEMKAYDCVNKFKKTIRHE